MMFFRPMRSESHPNKVKKGMPMTTAMATTMAAVRAFTFRMERFSCFRGQQAVLRFLAGQPHS